MCTCAMFVRVCKHWGLMSAKHKGHTVIMYSTQPTKQLKNKNSLQSHTPFQHILPAQMDASVIDMREKNRNSKIRK